MDLISFPVEILINICSYLKPKDCVSLLHASKTFYNTFNTDFIWKNIYTKIKHAYPSDYSEINPYLDNVCTEFIHSNHLRNYMCHMYERYLWENKKCKITKVSSEEISKAANMPSRPYMEIVMSDYNCGTIVFHLERPGWIKGGVLQIWSAGTTLKLLANLDVASYDEMNQYDTSVFVMKHNRLYICTGGGGGGSHLLTCYDLSPILLSNVDKPTIKGKKDDILKTCFKKELNTNVERPVVIYDDNLLLITKNGSRNVVDICDPLTAEIKKSITFEENVRVRGAQIMSKSLFIYTFKRSNNWDFDDETLVYDVQEETLMSKDTESSPKIEPADCGICNLSSFIEKEPSLTFPEKSIDYGCVYNLRRNLYLIYDWNYLLNREIKCINRNKIPQCQKCKDTFSHPNNPSGDYLEIFSNDDYLLKIEGNTLFVYRIYEHGVKHLYSFWIGDTPLDPREMRSAILYGDSNKILTYTEQPPSIDLIRFTPNFQD